jgi:hypothetical protein
MFVELRNAWGRKVWCVIDASGRVVCRSDERSDAIAILKSLGGNFYADAAEAE